MLTTANGSIGSVPVDWDAVPPGATDVQGQFEVTGSTEFGEVTAVIDVVSP